MNMSGKPVGTMGNDENMPREYMLRVTEPAEPAGGGQFRPGAIDQMHEGRPQHPRTVGTSSEKYKLWQLFDNTEDQGQLTTGPDQVPGGLNVLHADMSRQRNHLRLRFR